MKTVVRKSVKLDIPLVARFVADRDGMASPEVLDEIQAAFGCGRRAAQDALTILVSGGWLDRKGSPLDGRRKHYFVTDKGWDDLPTWSGEREMRLARWEHSTTSTRARTRPSRRSERDGLHWPHRDGLKWPHPPSGFLSCDLYPIIRQRAVKALVVPGACVRARA